MSSSEENKIPITVRSNLPEEQKKINEELCVLQLSLQLPPSAAQLGCWCAEV